MVVGDQNRGSHAEWPLFVERSMKYPALMAGGFIEVNSFSTGEGGTHQVVRSSHFIACSKLLKITFRGTCARMAGNSPISTAAAGATNDPLSSGSGFIASMF